MAHFQPTFADKLALIPNIARVLFAALSRSITGPFLGGGRARTYLKDILYAALRKHLSIISIGTEQWTNATTEAGYLDLAKQKDFQPETTVLESGLKLHWIGTKTARKVLLYFHGGGYVLGCSPGHFLWLSQLQADLEKQSEGGVSVVVVAYTLAPHATYPTQLIEAAESLAWLTGTQKMRPRDIIVAGDSAGGNLATSLLLHLLHPHPALRDPDTRLALGEPLAAAVLISPWWTFVPSDDASVTRNATTDIVTPAAARRWSRLFLGPSGVEDKYNQPCLADSTWFKGLDTVVQEVLVWGGGGEILLDSIRSTAVKLQAAHSRVELVVEEGAAHEEFILEKMMGYDGREGEGAELVAKWMAESMK